MFIKLPDDIILNTEHVTSVRFTPERSGFDEKKKKSYHLQASLIIGLTETEPKLIADDRGGHLGVTAVTCTLRYYREDAINIWNYFNLLTANR